MESLIGNNLLRITFLFTTDSLDNRIPFQRLFLGFDETSFWLNVFFIPRIFVYYAFYFTYGMIGTLPSNVDQNIQTSATNSAVAVHHWEYGL